MDAVATLIVRQGQSPLPAAWPFVVKLLMARMELQESDSGVHRGHCHPPSSATSTILCLTEAVTLITSSLLSP